MSQEEAMPASAVRSLSRIPARSADGLFHVVIDTPLGSRVKYKYDRSLEIFKLSKVLPEGLQFPCNFGFVPGTRGEDGDEVDVMVLCPEALCAGTLLSVRLLGALRGRQSAGRKLIRNDRLLGVPVTQANPPAVRSLRQLGRPWLKQLEAFFVSYNAQQGRRFRPLGWVGARAAVALIAAAQESTSAPRPRQ
jgi:inorganic pyrophosphatase